jgi:predicted permease
VALGFLQAVMLLVLLAVCGNTANLMLARASSRHREIGVRLALGAGPFRVVRLMLVESLVLALGGALLGVLIAVWGTDALRAMPAYGAFPLRFQTRVDSLGLAVALLLGVGSGLLFGAAPAVQLARVDLQRALRIGVGVGGRSVVRNALMGIQVGLALLVLAVAALFFQGFVETRDTDPGFRSEGVLLATYDLTGRFDQDTYRRQFAARLLERLHTSPAVESSGISSSVPLDIHGLPLRSFLLEGRAQAQAAPDQALANTVTPGYFRTMGIPFVAGADFADLDDASAPPQAIVNEEFVRRFAAGAEPVGRRLESRGRTFVIAGVVRNSLYEAFGEPATPIIYFSYRDRASAMGEVHLRARAGAELALASEVQRAVHDLDPSLPVYNIRTLTEHIDRNLMLRRIPARMFVVIGPLLLVLVAFGIYGVVAYVVAHRTAEIGVRLALGASTRRVVRQIVGESFRPIAIGAFLGWAGALVIDMHLFRGASLDLVVLLTVPAILLGVALFASWLPARRASAVDPVATLRSE